MFEHRYQTLLGAAGVLAFLAGLAWIFFFDALHLRPGIRLHVEFSRLSILDTGAAVKIGAQKVGVVEKIQFRSDVGRVRVTLWIDQRMAPHIFSNSRVYLESLSLIGERHVNIVLPSAEEPLGNPVTDGDVLRGQDPAHMDNLMIKLYDSLITNLRMWRELGPQIREVEAQLREFERHRPFLEDTLLPRARSILKKARAFPEPGGWIRVGDRLPDLSLLAQITKLLDDLEAASGRLKGFSRELEQGVHVWTRAPFAPRIRRLKARLERIEKELEALQQEGRRLVAALDSPEGTLQSFIRDPSIYNDLRMMARRLKNAPLDLLFKRKEKRTVK
ncbi:MCE family protein [Myxococcota bacterium]|nr:MCE family protein [Myxococcota bacterium]